VISDDTLDKLISSSKNYYNTMHSNMREAADFYWQRYRIKIELPESISVYKSARATSAVDDLKDQVRVDEPVIKAKRFGEGKTPVDLASKQTIWAKALFKKFAEEGQVDPFSQQPFDMILSGAGVLKLVIKPTAMANRPTRKEGEATRKFNKRLKEWRQTKASMSALQLTAIDPKQVLISPGPGIPRYAIEIQKRRTIDMWQVYPEWSDPRAKVTGRKELKLADKENPLREVNWEEYWSWYYDAAEDKWKGDYVIRADGERLNKKREDGSEITDNPYGFVPYVWRYGGLGRVNDSSDPSEMAVGALTSILGELENEILLKTALAAAWQFHVFPRLIVKGMNAAEAKKRFSKGPGGIIEVPDDINDIKWLETAQPNPSMMQFLSVIDAAIDRRVSPTLGGSAEAEFGILQAQLVGQALKVISPIRANLNYMGTRIADMAANLMERFDLSMNVMGTMADGVEKEFMMTGDDFKKHAFDVSFEVVDPKENERSMLAGLAVKRDPNSMSRATFWKIFMPGIIDNPETEEEQLMMERVVDQFIDGGFMLKSLLAAVQNLQQQGQIDDAGQAIAGEIQGVGSQAADILGSRAGGVEQLAASPGLTTESQSTGQSAQATSTQGVP